MRSNSPSASAPPPPVRSKLQDEVLSIWEMQRTTVLFVTHSIDEALLLATGAPDRTLLPWLAGAGAVSVGAALGTWWLTRRRGR